MKANYPDSKIELKEGKAGIFDITCDDKLIFSKKDTEGQRFPHEGEVARLIKEKKG